MTTHILAFHRSNEDGELCPVVGIDFAPGDPLTGAENSWSEDDFLDIVRREAIKCQNAVCVGEPFFVGVLQAGAQGLELVPIAGVEPSDGAIAA